MDIYLPIAEVSLDIFVLLGLGAAVGFLSGVFGVGGGFLLTPLLIFIGVPPTVAVASSANQLVGASVSGVLAHWRRGNVDFKMGYVLLIGGLVGSLLGVWIFTLLKRLGQVELTISIGYVLLLGALGFAHRPCSIAPQVGVAARIAIGVGQSGFSETRGCGDAVCQCAAESADGTQRSGHRCILRNTGSAFGWPAQQVSADRVA